MLLRHLPLLLILLCRPHAVFSQATSPDLCLPAARVVRIADSLRVLPLVRQEAAAWQRAYHAADSASVRKGQQATALQQAYRLEVAAVAAKSDEVAAATLQVVLWKATARRRGRRLAGVLGTVAASAAGLLYLSHR
jgi:hypothetical protein